MADLTGGVPSDEILTAYLDNELDADERRLLDERVAADPSTKARLDALAASTRPYRESFALILDAAPKERLEAMLGEAAPRAAPAAPRAFWAAAAAIILFAAGIGLGIATRPVEPTTVAQQVPATNWRQVVAEYLVLTTPGTLGVLPDNPALPAELTAYAGKLQVPLTTDKLALPRASLKDVRLFDYRGKPLVEAAYLSDDAMAVAFCIILNGQADAPIAFEQREGQNIVFWTSGGHGYMVAGKAPRATLEAVARDLAARFT